MSETNNKQIKDITAIDFFVLLLAKKFSSLGFSLKQFATTGKHIKSSEFVEHALTIYFSGGEVYLITDLKELVHVSAYQDYRAVSESVKGQATIHIELTPLIKEFINILGLKDTPRKEDLQAQIKRDRFGKEEGIIKAMREKSVDHISAKQTANGWKVEGKRYVKKNIAQEIKKQTLKRKKSKIETIISDYGKPTTASIEEEID